MDPRESAEFIAERSQNVFIHNEKIRNLTEHLHKALESNELRLGSIKEHETFPDLEEEDAINYVFLLDTLNFCFWTKPGEEKWVVEYDGKLYTGYFGLSAAIGKAIQVGINFYKPKVYSSFEVNDILKLFKGENGKNINLPKERVRCLHEAAQVLEDKYDGSFINCILAAEKSAEKLLNLIIADFPCFDDSAIYCDKKVSIHKRAQILVADIWSLYYGKGISEFLDIGYITMFADYRIPQVLVHFGVMSYGQELMEKLVNDEILQNGCEEEIEIRGCSIKVVEMLMADLEEYMETHQHYYCNSIMIDNYLWAYRRKEADNLEKIPFHKVYSVYY